MCGEDATEMEALTGILRPDAGGGTNYMWTNPALQSSSRSFPCPNSSPPFARRSSYKVANCLWGWEWSFPWKKQRVSCKTCFLVASCCFLHLSWNPTASFLGLFPTSGYLRNQTRSLGWKPPTCVLGHFYYGWGNKDCFSICFTFL